MIRSFPFLRLVLIATFVYQTNFSKDVHADHVHHEPLTGVTFNKDIAPVIHEKCTSCHRPGQAGPFSLINFKDVSRRAKTIEAVIESGYMPPWKPVNENVAFHNDRRLSADQKQLFKQWIENGKPEGDGPSPTPPAFVDGWQLGKPDLVVTMNGRFEVPADGPDVYRSFVFPIQLPEDRWIKAIEYRPTATASVHHAIFFVDQTGHARAIDGSDGKPGIEGMSFLSPTGIPNRETHRAGRRGLFSRNQNGQTEEPSASVFSRGLGGYVPGTTPTKLPGDLALHLPKQSDVVMQTHFHPSGRTEFEAGRIALYFADKAPSKQIVPIQIPAMFGVGVGLKVPAGEANYQVTESYTTPVDIRSISIGAHAHYICKSAKMTARLPNGETNVLMEIDDWDLDWQDRYFFKHALVLPKGTTLTSELIYDNTDNNPENPNSPPVEIRWGRESGDEMGSVTIQAIAVNESERPQLQASLRKYYAASISQGDLVDLLMQLDTNRDGGLQPTEMPARLAGRFKFFDRDRSGAVEPNELELVKKVMQGFLKANRSSGRFK